MGCHDGDTVEDYHNSSSIKEYRTFHLVEAKKSLQLALEHSYLKKNRSKIETLLRKVNTLLLEEQL